MQNTARKEKKESLDTYNATRVANNGEFIYKYTVEYPLPRLIGTRDVINFRTFQVVEYLHIYNEMSWGRRIQD